MPPGYMLGRTTAGVGDVELLTPTHVAQAIAATGIVSKPGDAPALVGTANRITVTGGVIDISGAYVGQASIVTLGTVTTGVWSAGIVTAPSLVPSGSTVPANGMFLPAANSVGFATNSAERERIDGVGNLMMGRTAALTTTDMQLSASAFTDSYFSVEKAAVAGKAETLQTWKVSDSPNFYYMSNVSTADASFSATFGFRNVDNDPTSRLVIASEMLSAADSGTVPAIVVTALTRTSTQVFGALATRPIISIRNLTTDILTVAAANRVGIVTTTPVSALHVAGTTGLTWAVGADSSGLATVGTGGATGGSLWVNTPSLSATSQSGLGVTGTYGTPARRAVVNINAYGPNSAGGYGSDLAFSTTLNGVLTEAVRIDANLNCGVGVAVPGTKLDVNGPIKTAGYTVATLPAPVAGLTGAMAYVTDALAPAFLTIVVGGGTVITPVFCNGTNWIGG